MKQTIDLHQFRDAFQGCRPDNFTYEGLSALFNFLETEEGMELDVIAICCDFTEYENIIECASEYFEFEGMKFNEEGDEMETLEEVEDKARDFLGDRTSLIEFKEGVIIQDF